MAVQWEERFETNENLIDDQHKKIFEFVNSLEGYLNGALDGAALGRLMDFLAMYVKSHFAYEEISMLRYKCPVAQQNKELHKKFLDAFQTLQVRYKTEGASREIATKLLDLTSGWLVNHICKIDTQMRSCVSNN